MTHFLRKKVFFYKNVGKTCFILSKQQDKYIRKNIFIILTTKKNCTFQCNFRKIRLLSDMFITVTTVRNEILEGTDRFVSDLVVILKRERLFRF